MFVHDAVHATCAPTKALLVPTEAVIQTGRRTVVMLAEDDGTLPAGRRRDRRRKRRPDRDQARADGRPAGRRVRPVPDRLGSEPARRRGAAEREQPPQARRPGERATSRRRRQGRGDRRRRDHACRTGRSRRCKWGPMTMDFKLPAGGCRRALAGRRPRDLRVLRWTRRACRPTDRAWRRSRARRAAAGSKP